MIKIQVVKITPLDAEGNEVEIGESYGITLTDDQSTVLINTVDKTEVLGKSPKEIFEYVKEYTRFSSNDDVEEIIRATRNHGWVSVNGVNIPT